MAKVLFVVPRFHTNLFFATRALVEAGFGVAVFANRRGEIEDHGLVRPVVFGDRPARREVEAEWTAFGPDLAMIRKASDLSPIALRLARRHRTRALRYSLMPMTTRPPMARRLREALRRAPALRVTPVPGLDGAAPVDPAAIYLPWPVARWPADAPGVVEASPLRLLCVGKLAQPRKGHDRLVEAIAKAGLAGRVTLTIVGSADRRVSGADLAYQDRVMAYAALDWIDIRSDVPFEGMGAIYAAHDVCVLPSSAEPLGCAPVEAMAYGCIPVVSIAAGSAGYVRPGENGLRIDPEDPASIGEALKRLVEEPALRAQLRAGVAQTAETELSPGKFLERIRALLPRQAGGG